MKIGKIFRHRQKVRDEPTMHDETEEELPKVAGKPTLVYPITKKTYQLMIGTPMVMKKLHGIL